MTILMLNIEENFKHFSYEIIQIGPSRRISCVGSVTISFYYCLLLVFGRRQVKIYILLVQPDFFLLKRIA